MRYCPDCGTGHECEAETSTRTDPSVEIARINADRDIAVAKLANRQARAELETLEEVVETQAEADVAAAVAEAEIVGDAIEAGAEPAEVIVDAPPPPPEDDTPDDAPPVVEGSEPPAPRKKSTGLGMW